MGNVRELNIKNRTNFFHDDMINIKDLDSNLLKIDKKSYKNIDIYYNGYITMKDSDYVKINIVNLLYLIKQLDTLNKVMEINTWFLLLQIKINNYWQNTQNFGGGIKNLVKKIENESAEYGKDFMWIKFNSDDNIPLNKLLKLHDMTIVIRSIFKEDDKYYPQVFLVECLYEL